MAGGVQCFLLCCIGYWSSDYRVYVGVIWGEWKKKLETTIMGFMGFYGDHGKENGDYRDYKGSMESSKLHRPPTT